jgi:hypothetical protein
MFENRAICEITLKNIVEPKDYRHTLGIRNSYCLSTAIMVVRMRLNVTLHVHTWPVLLSHAKDNVT